MVEEVVMTSDRPNIASKLKFVPLYRDFCFVFGDLGVVEFRLSSFRVYLLLFLPEGAYALLDKGFCGACWGWNVDNVGLLCTLFGQLVGFFISASADMSLCPDKDHLLVVDQVELVDGLKCEFGFEEVGLECS